MLKDTPRPTPICEVSHIPILCVSAMVFGNPRTLEKRGQDTIVQAAKMHTDGDHLHRMFRDHGGVKLCLSGHIHLVDRCEIEGVTSICDGAVSANWWKGPLQGTPEGYGVVDLWADGRFEHRYQPHGWKAEGVAGRTASTRWARWRAGSILPHSKLLAGLASAHGVW